MSIGNPTRKPRLPKSSSRRLADLTLHCRRELFEWVASELINARTSGNSGSGTKHSPPDNGVNQFSVPAEAPALVTSDLEPEILSTVLHLFALVYGAEQDSDLNAGMQALYDDTVKFGARLVNDVPGLPRPIRLPEHIVRPLYKRVVAERDLFADVDALGFTYQYFQKAFRTKTQKSIQSANKATSQTELTAFTQIYTPRWIIEFLVQNTVIPQLDPELIERIHAPYVMRALSSPTSVPEAVAADRGYVDPSELRIIDPACGSGHFLHYAFDLLYAIHLNRNVSPEQAASLAVSQLFGADIDARGLHVAALSMLIAYWRKTGEKPLHAWMNLQYVGEHVLGSLNKTYPKEHPLSGKFDAVVTNPPYIGRKLMSRELAAAIKGDYAECGNDLSTPFIFRAAELLRSSGRLGFITQASILSLPSASPVRQLFLEQCPLSISVELGTGAFPLQSGEKVNSVLIVAANASAENGKDEPTVFINVSDSPEKEALLAKMIQAPEDFNERGYFLRKLNQFSLSQSNSFYYSCPENLLHVIQQCERLETIAEVRQGLATTDNTRFIRNIGDVSQSDIGKIWFPYLKGAGAQRWFSPVKHVVNYAQNGKEIKNAVAEKYPYLNGNVAWVVKNEEFYFKRGLCFSYVSTEDFAVRIMPPGCIFDVAASAIFCDDSTLLFLLGFLNSKLLRSISKLINPTINMQVGDIKRLPLLTFSESQRCELAQLSRKCIELKIQIDAQSQALTGFCGETKSWQNFDAACFNSPESDFIPALDAPLFSLDMPTHDAKTEAQQLQLELSEVEKRIDEIVLSCAELAEWSLDEKRTLRAWTERTTTAAML